MGKFSVLLVVMTGVAHAQTPGEPVPDTGGHWAVAASLGIVSLSPQELLPQTPIGGGVLELGGSYRVLPALDIALEIEGGGNKEDTLTGIFIDGRVRIVPESIWNVLLVGGFGGVALAAKQGGDAETKARGAFHAGAALERRFGHLALVGELRLVAIAANRNEIEIPEMDAQIGVSMALGASYRF